MKDTQPVGLSNLQLLYPEAFRGLGNFFITRIGSDDLEARKATHTHTMSTQLTASHSRDEDYADDNSTAGCLKDTAGSVGKNDIVLPTSMSILTAYLGPFSLQLHNE